MALFRSGTPRRQGGSRPPIRTVDPLVRGNPQLISGRITTMAEVDAYFDRKLIEIKREGR